jgi:hypothetical protein
MEKDRKISLDDLSSHIDKGIAGADVLRANELGRLQVVLRAKGANLRRERARLSAKLGATHARVTELASKIEINRGLLGDVATETERARTPVPDADAKTWVLHGYVRDPERNGVANLTVALYDERARWIEPLGYACTEENGYFRLESHTFGEVTRPAFIRVLNQQRVHLYADAVPFTPAGGHVDYREIVLPGDGQACTPPGESGNEPPSQPGGTGGTGPVPDPNAWVVRGRVTDKAGKGLSGLTVSVYDKDFFFDDRLGQTETDANGSYLLTYRTKDFRDLIEKKPDIYVKVMDQNRKTLYTSKGAIRYEAGRVEVIDVEIER